MDFGSIIQNFPHSAVINISMSCISLMHVEKTELLQENKSVHVQHVSATTRRTIKQRDHHCPSPPAEQMESGLCSSIIHVNLHVSYCTCFVKQVSRSPQLFFALHHYCENTR